jgi:hypothetical protein
MDEQEGLPYTLPQQQQLLDEIHKRDDDAQVELVDEDGMVLRVTTSLALDTMTPLAAEAPDTLPYSASAPNLFVEPPDNATIAVTKYLFMGMALSSLLSVMLALPLYMWAVPTTVLIVVVVVSAIHMMVSYVAMCLVRNVRGPYWLPVAGSLLACWFISFFCMMGAAAGLSHSLVPFQMMSMSWIQYVALSMYLQWLGPRAKETSFLHAALIMAFASLILWGISIFTFTRDHNWLQALGMLCYAFGLIMYAARQMQTAVDKKRYALNRDDLAAAFVNYQVDLLMDCCVSFRAN